MASAPDTGRPLKFQTAAELQQKIDEYFGKCEPHIAKQQVQVRKQDGSMYWAEQEYMTDQQPYTITGLALALDTTRKTLLDYETGDYDNKDLDEGIRQEFSDTIKKAKLKIHEFNESRLFSGQMVAGVIFSLKNNFGWKDSKELTGKDGAPLVMSPADASAIQTAISELGEIANGNSAGLTPAAPIVSESGESAGV